MKIFTLIAFLILSACSREVPVKVPIAQEACKTVVEKTSATNAQVAAQSMETLKVLDWGPQSTSVGVNPNAQPGGELGIWMRVSSTKELGEIQLMFNGQAATTTTVVDDGLITAAVSANQLNTLGKKQVDLLQVQTKKIVPVGVFDVLSN